MQLAQLCSTLPKGSFELKGSSSREITSLTWDYAQVKPGSLYFCLEEEEFQEAHIKNTSLDHWQDAVKKGAAALVAKPGRITADLGEVALLQVEEPNQVMGLLARAFFQQPFEGMKLVGITGTNGKTTTSQLLDAIFREAGQPTGVIGTIGFFYPSGREEPSHLSNPLATELFTIGRRLRLEGAHNLIMEVTSHGMAFDRTYAMDFDIAVFTNLTQDHLDSHGSFEVYKACKIKHFSRLGTGKKNAYGIINLDDTSAHEFIKAMEPRRSNGKVTLLTYGVRDKNADLVAYPREMDGRHSRFDLFLRGDNLCSIDLPMPGLFNIYNALAAFGSAFALGVPIERIVKGLGHAAQVDGRFEKVQVDAPYDIFVDYAHTPDALEKILREVRGITRGRLISVFGCGGDRDRTKRPQMGQISAQLADLTFVTADNPRSEPAGKISQEILAGVSPDLRSKLVVQEDRRLAIEQALERAAPGDSVVIAGKGHETTQQIGSVKHPFSDRLVVLEYFKTPKANFNRARVEINVKQLRKNLELILADLPKGLKAMAVVKDDALGHGKLFMAKEALKAGFAMLGVACLKEALELREGGLNQAEILVFGERMPDELNLCLAHDLTLQIQSYELAAELSRQALLNKKRARVHFKVDSGMGRYGVRWEQAAEVFSRMVGLPGLEVMGIFTHFAQSDEADKTYAQLQWERFSSVTEELKKRGILPKYVHACNSGGYLDLPFAHGNLVRLGTLPTGVYPSKVCRRIEVKGEALKPVLSLKARIGFIKELQPGDRLGYGMHFTAQQKTRVAVLPLGYGDGYPRLRNLGHVLIEGKIAPLLGGNAMDATLVDITQIPEARIGTEVMLLGRQGEQEITAMMLADWAKTVTYDVLSRWTARLERVYN